MTSALLLVVEVEEAGWLGMDMSSMAQDSQHPLQIGLPVPSCMATVSGPLIHGQRQLVHHQ